MGIKGINELIKRHAPDAFFRLPIEKLAGKRIAIDANNWMYTYMAIARKKIVNKTDVIMEEPNVYEIRREWVLFAINFICGWLSYNITPVFVFDGAYHIEKLATQKKRSSDRASHKVKIDLLYEQLKGNILETPANIAEELRKELKNYVVITPEDADLFYSIIRGIGIPCMKSTLDGEQLCSMLCIEGKVAAVFSVDTDNMVYGCPLVINKFSDVYSYDSNNERIANLECVRIDKALQGLKISHSAFVDLCIMCGCDFNTNMPMYGAIKSYALINKYGLIDNLPKTFNTECLRHVRCRDIFRYLPSAKVTKAENFEISFDVNKEALINARDYLDLVGASGQIEKLMAHYRELKSATDGYVEELQLEFVPHYVPPQIALKLNIISSSSIVAPELRLNIIK